MVSKQSQEETESRPNIGRIPALIAAVAIVGIAIGAAAVLLYAHAVPSRAFRAWIHRERA